MREIDSRSLPPTELNLSELDSSKQAQERLMELVNGEEHSTAFTNYMPQVNQKRERAGVGAFTSESLGVGVAFGLSSKDLGLHSVAIDYLRIREKGEEDPLLDMACADLREADLREADLRWTNLREADLGWADLRWADLRKADLRWTNLRWTNLRGANLREADLRCADLRCADLRWANLRRADLRWADLRKADLREADLRWARQGQF